MIVKAVTWDDNVPRERTGLLSIQDMSLHTMPHVLKTQPGVTILTNYVLPVEKLSWKVFNIDMVNYLFIIITSEGYEIKYFADCACERAFP